MENLYIPILNNDNDFEEKDVHDKFLLYSINENYDGVPENLDTKAPCYCERIRKKLNNLQEYFEKFNNKNDYRWPDLGFQTQNGFPLKNRKGKRQIKIRSIYKELDDNCQSILLGLFLKMAVLIQGYEFRDDNNILCVTGSIGLDDGKFKLVSVGKIPEKFKDEFLSMATNESDPAKKYIFLYVGDEIKMTEEILRIEIENEIDGKIPDNVLFKHFHPGSFVTDILNDKEIFKPNNKFGIDYVEEKNMLHEVIGKNELLIIPDPDNLFKYLVYIFLYDETSLEEFGIYIRKFIGGDNEENYDMITNITIFSEDKERGVRSIGQKMKLFLFEKDIKFYSVNEFILPYVSEFAHDIYNIEKILEGEFEKIKPLTCEIFPTINCPNRCTECSYKMHKNVFGAWFKKDMEGKQWHMDWKDNAEKVSSDEEISDAEKIIEKIREYGIKYLLITGGGEPLSNFEATCKILEKAYNFKKDGKWNIKYGIYTCAILEPNNENEDITKLLEYEPDFIRISVNSATKVIYDAHHNPIEKGINYFDRIDKNIGALLSKKQRENKKTRIGLSYLIDKTTIIDLENGEFLKWILKLKNKDVVNNDYNEGKSLEFDFIRFTPVIDYFHHKQYEQEFFDDAVEKIKEITSKIQEKTNTQIIPFYKRLNNINDTKVEFYNKCYGSRLFLEVGCDGSTYICCETMFLPGYKTGNILEDSSSKIEENKNKLMEAINGNELNACSIFCKPHNNNKILSKIEEKLKSKKTPMEKWLKGLHNYWINWTPESIERWKGKDEKSRFKKPQIVAF